LSSLQQLQTMTMYPWEQHFSQCLFVIGISKIENQIIPK